MESSKLTARVYGRQIYTVAVFFYLSLHSTAHRHDHTAPGQGVMLAIVKLFSCGIVNSFVWLFRCIDLLWCIDLLKYLLALFSGL